MDARTFPMYMTSSIPVESWRVEGNATSNSQSRSSSERTEREAPRRVVRSISRREERPRWFSDILSRWLAVPVVGRGGEVGTPVVPDCTLLRSGGARGSSGEPSNQSWISHHRPENVIFGPTPSAPPALARSLSLSLSLSLPLTIRHKRKVSRPSVPSAGLVHFRIFLSRVLTRTPMVYQPPLLNTSRSYRRIHDFYSSRLEIFFVFVNQFIYSYWTSAHARESSGYTTGLWHNVSHSCYWSVQRSRTHVFRFNRYREYKNKGCEGVDKLSWLSS